MKIYVSADEILGELADKNSAEEALGKYFDVDDESPLSSKMKLKDNVVLEERSASEKRIRARTIIDVANDISRHVRLRRYRDSVRKDNNKIKIVSEGDSWFQHPATIDTIDYLGRWYNILSLGAAGDNFLEYIKNDGNKDPEYLAAVKQEQPRFLLLSGGGNDLFDAFGGLLVKHTPANGAGAERFLNRNYEELIVKIIEAYGEVFDAVNSASPATTVMVHGYDYVGPVTGYRGDSLWAKMVDDNIKITNADDQKALIAYMIDDFNERLGAIAGENDNAEYVNLRNVVGKRWRDEIHPRDTGFRAVAEKFAERINALA